MEVPMAEIYCAAARRACCLVVAALAVAGATAAGDVVVVANRTAEPVEALVVVDGGPPRPLMLGPGDSRPIFAEQGVHVRGTPPGSTRDVPLAPGCAYFLSAGGPDKPLQAARIPLGEQLPRRWPAAVARPLYTPAVGEITIKILVDDDEYRPRGVWEAEIRQRVERASEILAAHAGIRLKVVAVDTWVSDDAVHDFERSMKEFERLAHPAPAQVAIGFSSQYEIQSGRVHMGGTRGPLHSHILVKERARHILESERLALLVHELGHFLGATHSAKPTSVMRPVLGPGQQRLASTAIRFDPPNTLLMALLGEDIRRRGLRDYSEASPPTLRRMSEIYAVLEPQLPKDPATAQFRRLTAAAGTEPIVDDARKILGQIVRVAKLRQKQLQQPTPAERIAVSGDELTALYVRQAALAAKQVRRDSAPRALLIALAVAVNDPQQMGKIPLAGNLLKQLEGVQAQAERVAAIGEPTMRGRLDLTRHFFVSAELTALAGADFARGAGLAKEIGDSQGGSGFSFCDLAANEAGVRFAEALLTGQLSLDDIAQRFTVDGFLPSIAELPEGLQAAEFMRDFGSTGDQRYNAVISQIRTRVAALPGYLAPEARAPAGP